MVSFVGHTMPYVSFYALWCGLLLLWHKNRNLGELWLGTIVPIRTVFGTVAVLVGYVVAVTSVRNFTGLVLGTDVFLNDIFVDLLWSTLGNI